MTLRRPEGQDAYDWWAKMTLDDIKQARDIIEAAADAWPVLARMLAIIGSTNTVSARAVERLVQAVEAYEKEKG
jgi:hypothetical protein